MSSQRLLPVADVVPHAPPMLALDELLDWQPGHVVARMRVPDDRFARDGRMDAVMTLEYMAQAVAACLGHEAVQDGHGVRVGMVIACRSMVIHRPVLQVGEELRLDARRVRGSEAVSHFDTVTRDAAGAEVASAQLTLIHGEKPPEDRRG